MAAHGDLRRVRPVMGDADALALQDSTRRIAVPTGGSPPVVAVDGHRQPTVAMRSASAASFTGSRHVSPQPRDESVSTVQKQGYQHEFNDEPMNAGIEIRPTV